MPYIDATKAKQIVAIAKDYLGETVLSYVDKEGNGCGKSNKWSDLLCFYELYRVAGHRIDDLINTQSYQNVILKLLGKVALTPNYSLSTCGGNVITVNGGCGCAGGGSTTGPTSGCKDSTLSFTLPAAQTTITNPALIGVDILIAIREGVVMSTHSNNTNGYMFDSATGSFVANSPAGPAGEDFILLYRDCNAGGGIPIPPVGLRTGNYNIVADGVLTEFNVPHGGTVTPTWWDVAAAEREACGIIEKEPHATFIRIYYDVAPVAGSHLVTYAAR
jgi:hypothetical protein